MAKKMRWLKLKSRPSETANSPGQRAGDKRPLLSLILGLASLILLASGLGALISVAAVCSTVGIVLAVRAKRAHGWDRLIMFGLGLSITGLAVIVTAAVVVGVVLLQLAHGDFSLLAALWQKAEQHAVWPW